MDFIESAGAKLFLVDVFTRRALRGNPVAVVIPQTEPDAGTMQAVAEWIGMPETVFVMPHVADVRADYRVRIWSPMRELPFAGHPSIGAARVLISKGIAVPHDGGLLQECPMGLVPMRTCDASSGRIAFETPAPRVIPFGVDDTRAVTAALGADAAGCAVSFVDAGARWLVALFDRPDAIDRLTPDLHSIDGLSRVHDVSGITVVARTDRADAHYELRSFAPAIGVAEDAACGGGNACAAALIASRNGWREGSANAIATQGRHVGRDASIYWRGPDGLRRIEIGGFAVIVSEGNLCL